jgi:hypothetical protein
MNLRDVVTTLLSDLTLAQHRANELANQLGAKYRDDRLLRFFPVPNALLEEAVVTLRFAPRASEQEAATPEAGPAPMRPGEPHPSLALRLATAIVAPVCALLAERLRGAQGPARGRRRVLADALASDAVVRTLARRSQPLVHAFLERAAGAGPAGESPAPLLRELAPTLARALREDADLVEHLPDLEAAVAKALDDSRDAVHEALVHGAAAARALAEVAARIPQMEVIVDAPTLAQLPEHAVQTLTLKAGLRKYRWSVVDGDGAAATEDLLTQD